MVVSLARRERSEEKSADTTSVLRTGYVPYLSYVEQEHRSTTAVALYEQTKEERISVFEDTSYFAVCSNGGIHPDVMYHAIL